MTDAPQPLPPLKTWSHLAGRRRRPSEYEIVSTNLHYSTDNPDCPWELDPNIHMNDWYRKNRNESPLQHDDWNAFRDPDEMVYRTYNLVQDGQEAYVKGLLDQFSDREHDLGLEKDWVKVLAKAYTPVRYLYHTLQMGSAYLHQMAPSSTITNCGNFQTADSLRWLSHTAYRTAELAKTHPKAGFGDSERETWESDAAWQGYRELMEKALTAWDWGESFTAINLVAKPAIEAALLGQLGDTARHNGDTLLGLLSQAQMRDAERHRRWAGALVAMSLEKKSNKDVLGKWIKKWQPLANQAIDAYCTLLPDAPDAAKTAKKEVETFHKSLGL